MIDLNKHIWEGWTVQDFINELDIEIGLIMNDLSFRSPFTTREEVKNYCIDNQPYYKKYIKEVVDYFCNKFNIK